MILCEIYSFRNRTLKAIIKMSKIFPFPPSVTQRIDDINENRFPNVMIIGGNKSYKTSLLFRYALTLAKEQRNEIIFISPKVPENVPFNVHGMPEPDVESLEFIKYYYLSSYYEVIDFLCSFHHTNLSPIAIIIDDLSYIITKRPESDDAMRVKTQSNNERQMMTKLLALLVNTVNYCTKISKCKCLALTSFNCDTMSLGCRNIKDTPVIAKTIGERYLQVWSIEKFEDILHKQSFCMKSPKGFDSVLKVFYYAEHKTLFLNGVTIQ